MIVTKSDLSVDHSISRNDGLRSPVLRLSQDVNTQSGLLRRSQECYASSQNTVFCWIESRSNCCGGREATTMVSEGERSRDESVWKGLCRMVRDRNKNRSCAEVLCRGLSQAFYRERLHEKHYGFKDLESFMQGFWEAWACSKGDLQSVQDTNCIAKSEQIQRICL